MGLATRDLDNDTRGWIMCIISGIACVSGAAIICVDALVQLFPGKRSFRVAESNVFLACSLSLSFGVMLFSSLYSMLPESKEYLAKDDWSDQGAGLVVVSCFTGGFIGIQAISRLLHQFMPSHVVDCDHTHGDAAAQHGHPCDHGRGHSTSSRARRRVSRKRQPRLPDAEASKISENGNGEIAESTPLLRHGAPKLVPSSARADEMAQRPVSPLSSMRGRPAVTDPAAISRRPSMFHVQQRVMSFVKDTKSNCDELGSCYGFTDPCGQECFKHLSNRGSNVSHQATVIRTTTGPVYPHAGSLFQGAHHAGHHDGPGEASVSPHFRTSRATSRDPSSRGDETDAEGDEVDSHQDGTCSPMNEGDLESQHHHHVPTNAFLSIGLQTSIAIALHKFPEGFITYATNHANPDLGFNVFMALFVHNISEGFAMCLPLYMALGSRWRAMLWSALLGGLSQPMGAGIAVLWFKLASHTNITPNPVAYACLFAITAGIMVSVALQLFVESLSLNHDRNLCIFFGFLGMAILGLSNALFGNH